VLRSTRLLVAAPLVLAAGVLTACRPAADVHATATHGGAPRSASATAVTSAPVAASNLPIAPDSAAVAAFGATQLQAAAADDARIAQIALADCRRWTTGLVDPTLTTLLTPELLATAQQQARRPYATGQPPVLLEALPSDDGNGHDLAADAQRGCAASTPVRQSTMARLSVDRTGGQPRLVLVASYVLNLTIGSDHVSNSEAWTFTSITTPSGWQLAGAAPEAFFDWAPPLG
jgi:hypothetical protein